MRRFLFALVAVVVAACDPVVDKHTPDGHVADASPDAQTHGMVSLKVYDPNNTGAVVVGAPVVFIEADGTLVGHPSTGSDGIAMADVHKGASATVVITTQGSTQMQTIIALTPGDTIVLGPNTPPQTTDGTFVVSFPAYPGTANYRVYGPCGSGFSTVSPQTLTMYSDCKLATMDLQVIAYDQNDNPLAYIDKPAVAYTAGGNTTIAPSYLPMSTFTASYTNIDPAITSISMNRTVPDGYGPGGGTAGAPANGTFTATAIGPQGTDATIQTRAINGRLENVVIQKIPGNSLTYGLDVGATLLPWIGQPTFDVPSRKISVPITTTGTTMDQPTCSTRTSATRARSARRPPTSRG